MEKRAEIPKADMGFILSLMDELETEKGSLGEMDDPGVQVHSPTLLHSACFP